MREVAYVDAPGRHVRSHQDIDLFFLEFAQDLLALGLRNVAVKDFGRIAAFQEFGHDLVRARSGAGEDDAVELGFDVDDAGQGVELVAFAHLEIDLVRQVGGDVLRFDLQEVGVVHVVAGQRRDAVGHRGREEQHAFGAGHGVHDLFDILDETHVEHFVRLVEHQVGDRREVERAPADVVEDAARRADDDVDAFFQAPQLFGHRGAAVDRGDRKVVGIERNEFLRHLQGQFAGRNEDDGLRNIPSGSQHLDNRQAESGGFTRAGLCLCDDVFVGGEQVGNGEALNGRGGFEPFFGNGSKYIVGQS